MAKKLTLEYVKQQIKDLHPNSKLLSTEYKGCDIKLDLICENNHYFKMNWHNISQRHWCSECYGNKKKTIKEIIYFLNKKHPNSKLLSKEYKGCNIKLDLICEKNHPFKMSLDCINRGQWCSECAGNKKKIIEEVAIFINEKHSKAKLLSTEYKNSRSNLDLLCESGHFFKKKWDNIKSGQWCPICSRKKKKTIEDIITFVNENHKDSILSSKEYKNSKTNLNLVCENGHCFKKSWNAIHKGLWCPICSKYKGEQLVRKILEDKFKKLFPNVKPIWLKNPKTNHLLQLDGFCEELKIAFEYQGIQHYEYPNHCHKNKKQFEAQIYRDKIKRNLCKENNVILIEIKEIKDLSYENVELIVNSVLKEKDIIK